MSCCQNKPVRLNHLNTGTRHLADKPPVPNDWIPSNALVVPNKEISIPTKRTIISKAKRTSVV